MDKSTPLDTLRREPDDDQELAAADAQVADESYPADAYEPEPEDLDSRARAHHPPGIPHGPYGVPPPPHFAYNQGSMPPLESGGLAQWLLDEAKEPMLVAVLVLVVSNSHTQDLLGRALPAVVSSPLLHGVAQAAAIAGLFWLLRRFLPLR